MDLVERQSQLQRLQVIYQTEVTKLSRRNGREEGIKDSGERAAFEENESRRIRELTVASGRLCGINRALKLIKEEGWNGNCVDCGEEISDARIRAIVWATRCILCAEEKAPDPTILMTRRGRKVVGIGISAS